MLIVTLPQVHEEKLLQDIISHPVVGALRYNTGMDSAYSPSETLAKILEYTTFHRKPLYVDLKGRQLRVQEWATLPYGPIVLNHRIKVDLPAKIFFRVDDCCEIKEVVDGRKIYVDPLPRYPVGRGQSVNVLGENLRIEGTFSMNDYEYLKAALEANVRRFMLSFVESMDDIREFEEALSQRNGGKLPGAYELILKIESQKGIDFVKKEPKRTFKRFHLMAARDDLMIQIGAFAMLEALQTIIVKDPEAICASRLLLGLEHGGEISMADISDIWLMRQMGYKRCMLSDGISRKHFEKAAAFWKEYVSIYPPQ
jgi:hypothetical protein